MRVTSQLSQGLMLVRPADCPQVEPTAIYSTPQLADLERLPPAGTPVGVDYETRGTDASHPEFCVVGIGLSWEEEDGLKSVYYHLLGAAPAIIYGLLERLAGYSLCAHNVNFDAAATWRMALDYNWSTQWFNWTYCTYGLYRQLASEGYTGQRWGLEHAQHDLLGWASSNKDLVADWLMSHGYSRRVNKSLAADKSQLWRVPAEILGPYCAVDASSCYQLLTSVLLPAAEPFPELLQFHQTEFMTLTRLLIEQQFEGITVDEEALNNHYHHLVASRKALAEAVLALPEVKSGVEAYNEYCVERLIAKEPPKFKKNGDTSKTWENWAEKVHDARQAMHFNLGSTAQLGWLLYDWMGYPAKVLTESGQPSTNEKALGGMGDVGKLLIDERSFATEIGFVATCQELLREGKIHLQFRNPGTLTGRLAGTGGLNGQQLPHSPGYLSCWRPEDGYLWLDTDINSLEQVVLAELSGDKTLMQLYGPDAKRGHDVYLYNACFYPGLSEKVRQYYDPDNPSVEATALAKKECYHERKVSKVASLGFSYGMGPDKLMVNFNLAGIPMSLDEASAIHAAHWELYSGVRRYSRLLQQEWSDRGGWVYNGLRHPMPVAPEYTKDLINRVVQSTGHSILMMLIKYIEQLRRERGIGMYPVIVDFHDETLWAVRKNQIEQAKQLFTEAYAALNEELGGIIPIKGGLVVAHNLAEVKAD